jgi:hypothetical protein
MKALKFLPFVLILFLVGACGSINVKTDYDTKTDFSQYKTFAFYKKGIDKAPISDLDKRRILRAIETELQTKGMTKSKEPDVLVSIYTKAKKQIDVYNNYNPYYYGPYQRQQVIKYTEGTLLIDILDRNTKKLIWQGVGKGALSKSSKPEKREAVIQKFVQEILEEYPPEK